MLSESTLARLGDVLQEHHDEARSSESSSPPDLSGRLILVFWQYETILYSASDSPSGSVFSPAAPGARFKATEQAILIDPGGLANPSARINFTTGVISPDHTPEAVDGTSKNTSKTSSGSVQHSKVTGGKNSGDKTPRKGKGGDKGDGGSGRKGANRPTSYTSYNAGIGSAVDMLYELPQMVITAHEFLTFFPHHTKWPTVLFRLYRNGWTTGAIAKLMLHARGALNHAEWERRQAALRHQLRTAFANKYGQGSIPSTMRQNGHPDLQPNSQRVNGNNVDHYDVRQPLEPSGDMYGPPRAQGTLTEPATLQQVINGVVNWPTGEDAGQLTQALRYAQANGMLQQTTRDLPNIVTQQGWVAQADANTTQYDLRAAERLGNAIPNP